MKIYISLPITGREEAAREHADKMKAILSRNGYEVVNPFEIYAGKKANCKGKNDGKLDELRDDGEHEVLAQPQGRQTV